MDRRHFIATASGTAALMGVTSVNAQTTMSHGLLGRTVADFGVQPQTEADQAPALRRALMEAAATGFPLVFPPGIYSFRSAIQANGTVALLAPGTATLMISGTPPFLTVEGDLALRGLTIVASGDNAGSARSSNPLIVLKGRTAEIDACHFRAATLGAMDIETRTGNGQPTAIRVTHCEVICRAPYSVKIATGGGGNPALVTGNQIAGGGLYVEGDSLITGNTIADAPGAALKLGRPGRLGFITATNNMVYGSPVGIAISNAPDGYAMVTVNMIRGAKNGGIRAFDGDRYVGKDLVQSSSESFPYIAVGGNVSV